jgi:hypothetical protein
MTVAHLEFVFGLIAGTIFGLGLAVCYAAFRMRDK